MGNSKGYTLIELLAVIVIIGILAAIAVPVYLHFTDQYKEDLCEVNRVEMARLYGEFLNIEHISIVRLLLLSFLTQCLMGMFVRLVGS